MQRCARRCERRQLSGSRQHGQRGLMREVEVEVQMTWEPAEQELEVRVNSASPSNDADPTHRTPFCLGLRVCHQRSWLLDEKVDLVLELESRI